MCALVTKCDLEYWGIDELLLEPCCALRYYPEIELCVKEVEGEEISRIKTKERRQAEDFGPSKIGKIRKYLWNLTEYPETSKAAQVLLKNHWCCSTANIFKRDRAKAHTSWDHFCLQFGLVCSNLSDVDFI